jgi:hypothetical protein
MRALTLTAVLLCSCAHEEEPRVGPSQAAREAMERDANGDNGNTVMVDGYKMWRERWEEDSHTVRQKASFDLGCEKLQLHVLELMTGPGRDDWAQSIGVLGCGARARYTRLISRNRREELWLLESKSVDPASPPAQQPPAGPTQSL